MRNSNTMAIAPTATISNICGVAQSIEPAYQNLYVKSNMSGDFTVVNDFLVRDLKARGLWDEVMVSDLKYFDGSLGDIDRVPDDLKALYATAFEIDSAWLIKAAARRQKWIDQAQSLNLYIANPSGKKLDALYRLAWTTRAEDHLLSALALGDPCGEIDAQGHGRQAQRRVGDRACRRRARSDHSRPTPASCAIDDPCLRSLPMISESGESSMLDWSEARADPPAPFTPAVPTDPAAAADADGPRRDRPRRRARFGRRQGDDQLPRRRQPASAAEISLGLGEISRGLQQSLDADRSLDAGRHCAVEVPRRADRGRAPRHQAQPRILRGVGNRWSPTTSCWRSTAI